MSDARRALRDGPGLTLLLKQLERRIQQRLQPQLHGLGLTLEHWRVMSVLALEPGIAMAVLAEAAVLPAASLTRHVDRLVERGMIVRRVDPADRRRVVAALSPLGPSRRRAPACRGGRHRGGRERGAGRGSPPWPGQ